MVPTVAIFCAIRVSAIGPACIRRRSTSGLRSPQYMVGPDDTAVKIAMKTHACQ
jgi:hypothetical protein